MIFIFLLIINFIFCENTCATYSSDIDFEDYLEYILNTSNKLNVTYDKNRKYDQCNISHYTQNHLFIIDNVDDLFYFIEYVENLNDKSNPQIKSFIKLFKALKNGLYGIDITKFICKEGIYIKYKNYIDSIDDKNIPNLITNIICDGMMKIGFSNKKYINAPIMTYNNTNWPFKSHFLESLRSRNILIKKRGKIVKNSRARAEHSKVGVSDEIGYLIEKEKKYYQTIDIKGRFKKLTNITDVNDTEELERIKGLAKGLIVSTILAYRGSHPLTNNLIAKAIEDGKMRVKKYVDYHGIDIYPILKIFKKLIRGIKIFYYEIPSLDFILVKPFSAPEIINMVNETENYTLALMNDTNDSDELFNPLKYFTINSYLPSNANWKSYSRIENKYHFDFTFPADWISKFWFGINCWRRWEWVERRWPDLYEKADPNIGKFPCFYIVDEINFPNSTITSFLNVKDAYKDEHVPLFENFDTCDNYTDFFFWQDAIFLLPKILLSNILQPITCKISALSVPLVRFFVLNETDCSFNPGSIEFPKAYCFIPVWIGFTILFFIFVFPCLAFFCFNICRKFNNSQNTRVISEHDERLEAHDERVDRLEEDLEDRVEGLGNRIYNLETKLNNL